MLLDFKHFEETHSHLFSRNVFVDSREYIYFLDKIGFCFSRQNVNLKVIDNNKNEKQFDYLRPKGELVLLIDEIYGVPLITVNFDNLYTNNKRPWLNSDKVCYCFQCEIQRTPFDSWSLSSNNSCDTVH